MASHITETQKHIDTIQAALRRDLHACDLKWTLFVAAAQSFRYDSRLTPYPSKCVQNVAEASITERFDIESIRRSIESITNLRRISWPDLTVAAVDLLHWVLCEQTESSMMKSVPKENFSEILSKVVSDYQATQPTHIIELVPIAHSPAEQKFRAHLGSESKSLFAFHGSKIDSFHSIVSHGLQQHMCKTALFGDGIYLSSEMHVSLPFSPVSGGWKHSQLGAEMSCMALCEFVDHPVHLKRHATENNRGTVPEKYFVITNNDIVRVRYLLINGSAVSPTNYDESTMSVVPHASGRPMRPPSRLWTWFAANKAVITIILYILLLLLIGLGSSRTGMYWRHVVWTKMQVLLGTWTTWKNPDEELLSGIQWPTIRTPQQTEL